MVNGIYLPLSCQVCIDIWRCLDGDTGDTLDQMCVYICTLRFWTSTCTIILSLYICSSGQIVKGSLMDGAHQKKKMAVYHVYRVDSRDIPS